MLLIVPERIVFPLVHNLIVVKFRHLTRMPVVIHVPAPFGRPLRLCLRVNSCRPSPLYPRLPPRLSQFMLQLLDQKAVMHVILLEAVVRVMRLNYLVAHSAELDGVT